MVRLYEILNQQYTVIGY